MFNVSILQFKYDKNWDNNLKSFGDDWHLVLGDQFEQWIEAILLDNPYGACSSIHRWIWRRNKDV